MSVWPIGKAFDEQLPRYANESTQNYRRRLVETAFRFAWMAAYSNCRQETMDLAEVALNQRFGFGYERTGRFVEGFNEVLDWTMDIAKTDTPDRTYTKEQIDGLLKQFIPPEHFVDYKGRYEYDFTPDFLPEDLKGAVTEMDNRPVEN